MRKAIEWLTFDVLKALAIFIFLYELFCWIPTTNSTVVFYFFENVGGNIQKLLEQTMNDKAVLGYLFLGFSWIFGLGMWFSLRLAAIFIDHFKFERVEQGPFTQSYQFIRGIIRRKKGAV